MKKDNGSLPAFPPALAGVGGGLTKREFIAALALNGFLASTGISMPINPEVFASSSISLADALLAELEKDNAE